MWKEYFSSQNRERGICEVQNVQVTMVELAFVRKIGTLPSEIVRQLKLQYQNFFVIVVVV